MEFNRPARPAEIAAARRRDGAAATPVEHVHALGLQIGLPASLAEIGVAQERPARRWPRRPSGIKRLIDNNPRPLDADALEAILDAAWHGEPARLR